MKKFLFKSFASIMVGMVIAQSMGVFANSIDLDAGFSSGIPMGFNYPAYLTMVYQDDGKMILGGEFTKYKGIEANHIIKLNNDDTKDTSFDIGSGFNGTVKAIVIQNDGKIIVGGQFTTYKGVAANYIIRLNSDGSIDTSFVSGFGSGYDYPTIYSMAIQNDGKILVVGSQYNNSKGIIIRLNPDGSIDNSLDMGEGFNKTTKTIAIQSDGKILVGGEFTSYKGVSAYRVIRLNPDGSRDASFTNSLNNVVNTIKIQNNDKILIAGAFLGGIKRLNIDGSVDTSFSGSVNNEITSVEILNDGKIIAGGNFGRYKGVSKNNFVKLDSDGSIDSSFDIGNGFNQRVSVVKVNNNGDIVAIGNFSSYKGIAVNNTAVLNSSGDLVNTEIKNQGGFNDVVRVIATQNDGKPIIAGDFTNYKGVSVNKFLRLNTDGSIDTGFDIGSGFDNSQSLGMANIKSITIQNDGKIIVVGSFDMYQGQVANFIIRLNSDGSRDTSFDVGTIFNGPDGVVIKVGSDGKIIASKSFLNEQGQFGSGQIMRLNTNGTIDTGFNGGTGFNGSIDSITIQNDGKILVGGLFTSYQGNIANRIMRFNSDGSRDNMFDIVGLLDKTINNILIQPDGKILIAGMFKQLIQSGSLIGNCSDGRTNIDEVSCVIGSCSDGRTNIDQASCIASGVCTDTKYTDETSCITADAGYCTDSQYTDQTSCETSYSCSNGYSPDETSCLAAGSCSDGSSDDEYSCTTYACSDGTSPDETSCLGAGYCSDQVSTDQYTCESTYSCSDGTSPDETSCGENGATWGLGIWFNYGNTWRYWIPNGGTWDQNQWSSMPNSWTPFNWTNYGNTWIPGASIGGIARFNTNGTIDTGFSSLGSANFATQMTMQNDGKILFNGSTSNFNRLNIDGSIDTGFAIGEGVDSYVQSIAKTSSGKLFIGGQFNSYRGTPAGYLISLYGDSALVDLPNSTNTETINTAFKIQGYTEINGILVGSTPISLGNTDGNIPATLNIINQDINLSIPGSIQITAADGITNYSGIISVPISKNINSVNDHTVISAFNVGSTSESINLVGGEATISIPVPSQTIGQTIQIYYSNDNGVTRYPELVTQVVDKNGTPTVEFGTNHFANFALTQGIDTTTPTASVSYNITGTTNQDVIATLTGFSEPLTGINTTTHTFTGNGSFTFTFEDIAGNTGSVTATVNWIMAPTNTTGTNSIPSNNGGGGSSSYVSTIRTAANIGTNKKDGSIENSRYPTNMNDAYLWAYDIGITTLPTIQQANLDGKVYRSHLAKMLSEYAVKKLKKTANTGANCSFSDMTDQSLEMKTYATIACQLGLMGVKADGTPDAKFNPNAEVTRAEFGTALSRLLYGSTNNEVVGGERYSSHLQALKKAGIMTKIDKPTMSELRANVFLMLMRSVK